MSVLARFFGGLWRILDGFRKLLHLFLLLLILAIIVAGVWHEKAAVPRAAALLIAPQGALVDQLSGDALQRAVARVRGNQTPETRVKDVVDAIRAAATDKRIKALVLQLDGMGSAGLSKLQRIAKEIKQFKTSGKPVFAIGDSFNRDQYYLAAQADKIYMHPMGYVLIDGYSRYMPYYKDLLDKLYIDYNVWKVGNYKSFVEPITRESMSDFDKEASRAYLGGLWNGYQADITSARKLPADALQRYADEAPDLLRKAGGDTAKLALDYGLVDELLEHDLMRDRIREAIGPGKGSSESFPAIGYESYLRAVNAEVSAPSTEANKIAVITLSGEILDGMQPPGSIGSDSTVQLIRQAEQDSRVKALVLHVDSPGGSAFAADLILREIELFQQSGRPVIVSMDSVAASGGYWISMSADEIWANATTLTGSIGVGATLPTFQRTLAKLGVNVDGIGTTALSGEDLATRELGDNIKDILGQSIRNTYDKFIGQVAMFRGLSVDDVDRIAQGRVWTGSAALDRGLVDKLGSVDDAIASAAAMAGLKQDEYRVEYLEPPLTLTERFALQLVQAAAPLVKDLGGHSLLPSPVAKLLHSAEESLGFLARWNDPRGLYAYCFCAVH
ncbi:MAG TPA: signal peptide peptidase SppA [Gammaproteobacteria bacterium]|nr:signal peptide peptidase SppA [Gammaproteobacteria bacterium]